MLHQFEHILKHTRIELQNLLRQLRKQILALTPFHLRSQVKHYLSSVCTWKTSFTNGGDVITWDHCEKALGNILKC
jgi:hypothetical protein